MGEVWEVKKCVRGGEKVGYGTVDIVWERLRGVREGG